MQLCIGYLEVKYITLIFKDKLDITSQFVTNNIWWTAVFEIDVQLIGNIVVSILQMTF